MSFSLYLKKKISIKKINRSDLIAQLNLYHQEFNNLDAITLSRWITNKTTPSSYKQILIANFFNDDPIDFIKNHITIKKESKLVINLFDKVMKDIESSYSNISYFHSNEEANYSIDLLNNKKYNDLFFDFYMNFGIYKKLYKIYYRKNIQKNHICVIKRKNNIISSHLSLIKLDAQLSELLSDLFNVDINSEFFINLGYIEDRETYLFMSSLIFYFFYKNSVRYFTCLIRSEFLEFLTALPYKQIGSAYIDNERKLYLIQADFLDILSNPFIIKNFEKTLSDNNNNLDKFFSIDLIKSGQDRRKLLQKDLLL
ncbi:hypothetical protein [Photobacterium damselae]|uniref:hypothetical protein n=1 Tax=Photobacterium damselae TaxID=38293 RepID=UPI001EDFAF1B|nr:hypothetical protein [Photobacterium damselae]MCG3823123.1 hypothetical protein [Photobacterium damselae]